MKVSLVDCVYFPWVADHGLSFEGHADREIRPFLRRSDPHFFSHHSEKAHENLVEDRIFAKAMQFLIKSSNRNPLFWLVCRAVQNKKRQVLNCIETKFKFGFSNVRSLSRIV